MRNKVTSVLVTLSIISQVHALARPDGMPPGLKFLVIPTKFYSTLLGLHYDEEEFQDEDYEMESEDEEYDEENEEDKYDKMDENELAEIMGELHPHNVPNENNHTHIMFQQ